MQKLTSVVIKKENSSLIELFFGKDENLTINFDNCFPSKTTDRQLMVLHFF